MPMLFGSTACSKAEVMPYVSELIRETCASLAAVRLFLDIGMIVSSQTQIALRW